MKSKFPTGMRVTMLVGIIMILVIVFANINIKQVGSVDFGSATKNATSVHLNWNEAENADGYDIYRATSKDGKYKRIIKIKNKNTTDYIDSGLQSNTKYYYKISAYACTKVFGKNKYDLEYSPVHEYTTHRIKQVVRVDFSSATKNATSIHLYWDEAENADGYDIYRATSKDGEYEKIIKTKNENTTDYIDSGLQSNTNYYYKIRAYVDEKVEGKYRYALEYSPVHEYTTSIENTYIYVNISSQKLTYYENGIVKLQCDVVTGDLKTRLASPTGIYRVTQKATNITLHGKYVVVYVERWIGFIGSQYGFHDASWRNGEFGGEIYKTDGSHGCINMPTNSIKELYGLVGTGTKVVIE
ncbi:MAG: L,D-transpeptidase family protein [Peptostreptococcaceae bacterium]|nr:L,D-transpeptidase family protein [Peptostreptococcaceae bacterium]